MCWLGVWQVHRYHFKKNLLSTYQQRLIAAPKPFLQVADSADGLQFQPVWATGRYLNALTMLVQNQFYQDRVGFHVLTPLQIPGEKKLLLVDRGWIQQGDNQKLPGIDAVIGDVKITGDIKLLNEYQFTLGKNILEPDVLPLVMQKLILLKLAVLLIGHFILLLCD